MALLESIASRLKHRTIYGVRGPYLTKYKLLDLGKRLVRVYLHQAHRPDEDYALHNHPWKWAIVIILRNGYIERRGKMVPEHYLREPGNMYILSKSTYHKIAILPRGESWSLLIAGPDSGESWGFFDLFEHKFYLWRTFIQRKELLRRRL